MLMVHYCVSAYDPRSVILLQSFRRACSSRLSGSRAQALPAPAIFINHEIHEIHEKGVSGFGFTPSAPFCCKRAARRGLSALPSPFVYFVHFVVTPPGNVILPDLK